MRVTSIIYDGKYVEHKTSLGHPESPERLRAIDNGLKTTNILGAETIKVIKPRYASIEDLQLIHTSDYVEYVKQLSMSGGGILDQETETIVSPETFNVARLAAGGALEAVDMVMRGDARNAFVISRPPGHHAGRNYGLGFCIFNNVAIAAAHLLRNFGLTRVLIVDIDAHHGNGTQEVFYNTDNVLYLSLHQDPGRFPGVGFLEEVGEGKGIGYNVNIPLPFGTGDLVYWKAFKTVVAPIAIQYEPQFILVSAGFDSYYRDRIGELSLSAQIFPKLFQFLMELAERFCSGRLVAVLEGGYTLSFLRRIVPAVISRMCGLWMNIRESRPPINPQTQRKAEKILEDVKKVQSRFWKME